MKTADSNKTGGAEGIQLDMINLNRVYRVIKKKGASIESNRETSHIKVSNRPRKKMPGRIKKKKALNAAAKAKTALKISICNNRKREKRVKGSTTRKSAAGQM